VVPQATTAEKIEQTVHYVTKRDKRALLEHVLRAAGVDRALVFTRTKHGANRLVEQLDRANIRAAAIHGNKSQGARERALEGFKAGEIPVLIATDIAARGIDVDGITHVINYDLPEVPEQYVHRIGRTARAGAGGRAIAFCDDDERGLLKDIERIIRQRIPTAEPIALEQGVAASLERAERPRPPLQHRSRSGGSSSSSSQHASQGSRFQAPRVQNGSQSDARPSNLPSVNSSRGAAPPRKSSPSLSRRAYFVRPDERV
jgi:ATP-dependent RNA helicase RhlE